MTISAKKLGLIPLLWAVMISAHSQNLFGDPACNDWPKLQNEAKLVWLQAFLAPLNMAHMTRKKSAEDKYSKLPSLQPAVASLDTFCQLNSDHRASEGAINFLNIITGSD
jgi:hypothetical protein